MSGNVVSVIAKRFDVDILISSIVLRRLGAVMYFVGYVIVDIEKVCVCCRILHVWKTSFPS